VNTTYCLIYQDVVVNDKENQIISVASDNVIKVWEMRNYKCMQTIYAKSSEKSIDTPIICRLFFDQEKRVSDRLIWTIILRILHMQNFLALWLHLIVYGFISLDSPSRWNIP
jgi:WD40 repeat protein